MSRLLDEIDGVLPLREPLPLRTLADAHDVLHQQESLLSEARFDGDLALFMLNRLSPCGVNSSMMLGARTACWYVPRSL